MFFPHDTFHLRPCPMWSLKLFEWPVRTATLFLPTRKFAFSRIGASLREPRSLASLPESFTTRVREHINSRAILWTEAMGSLTCKGEKIYCLFYRRVAVGVGRKRSIFFVWIRPITHRQSRVILIQQCSPSDEAPSWPRQMPPFDFNFFQFGLERPRSSKNAIRFSSKHLSFIGSAARRPWPQFFRGAFSSNAAPSIYA